MIEREDLTHCVILPAHNEGRHLETVVGRIPDWVDGIVVVDDASTDDTLQVALGLTDARVRVLHPRWGQFRSGRVPGIVATPEQFRSCPCPATHAPDEAPAFTPSATSGTCIPSS